MSSDNGNGDRTSRPSTPLEVVEQRIAERVASEKEALRHTTTRSPPPLDDDPPSSEDLLRAWKKRKPGEPATLEQVHAGLIATCEYSEAAIESGIKMARDVHEITKSIELRTKQMAILSAKIEATSTHTHKVDTELAAHYKMMSQIRRDVQSLKDDAREVKETVRIIPVIKGMLGEILARLPEPSK